MEVQCAFFKNRDEVNKVCLMKGKMPEKLGEIGIDRMYADNNDLSVGDEIESGGHTWKITGLVALSDYSALFSNNNDSMFDSVKFGVSVVCPEEFDSYKTDQLNYSYAWKYNTEPKNEKAEKRHFGRSDGRCGKRSDTGRICPKIHEPGNHFHWG